MSIEEAYRQLRRTGCVYGTPQELKAQLVDIAEYLGIKDPIEFGAALLLEQAGYERTQSAAAARFSGSGPGGAPAALTVNEAEEGV